jgi:aminoglycoside phosphotransferase (APT) family kinase protein
MSPERVAAGIGQDLLRYLSAHLNVEELRFLVPPRRFRQGMFSDVLSFQLDRGPDDWMVPLVLRMLPLDADSDQPVLEAVVQNGLARINGPAPRVLLSHDRVDPLGRMFTVMEHVPGRPSVSGVRWDRFARDLPKLTLRWPATLARIANDLHACDPVGVFDEAASHGIQIDELSPQRHLRFVEDRLSSLNGGATLRALEWLHEFGPRQPQHGSVLHGDLWPANVLQRRGCITGIVDWERAAIGDPAFDIGFAKVGLALLPAPAQIPTPIRQAVNAAGRSMATRLEAEYAKLNSLSPQRVAYYEALRCALELAVVVGRRSNHALSERSGWEDGIGALADHFAKLTGVSIHKDLAT